MTSFSTEKSDGMFATIIIVLPSQFTGGAAHLSHGTLSTVYDCSATSALSTTVMSWYTDVTHEIKPITSGHRLALSYNLIHTSRALRPALSANTGLAVALRRVLALWERDAGRATQSKIVYLLEHTYGTAGLCAGALKGVDAHKVAMLDTLAKEMGFGLGLAGVECHMCGGAEDCGYDASYYGSRRRHGWGYDSEDDYGGMHSWADPEEVEKEMSIMHLVDLDGDLICDTLAYKETTETIPEDLTEEVESGQCDEEEYEGYQGNVGVSLARLTS